MDSSDMVRLRFSVGALLLLVRFIRMSQQLCGDIKCFSLYIK